MFTSVTSVEICVIVVLECCTRMLAVFLSVKVENSVGSQKVHFKFMS
jgi:hypothetical protein